VIELFVAVVTPYAVKGAKRAPHRETAMDRSLVEQARRGDREAFTSLAFELSDRLFAVAHRILRDLDSAGDALQVTLLRLFRLDLPYTGGPVRAERQPSARTSGRGWLRRTS
jgi:DNA-directed RNA polymerase specialized sigma24 family protein